MKSCIKYFSIIIALNIFSILTPKETVAQGMVNFQVFYDNLSPYGQWVDYPNYGYIWVPMAGPDFFPYASNGHWVYTNYGWTWVSNYNWGWAPFHYGRWSYDDYYGWFWIPDNIWGPAWVVWSTSPDYYGWSPLGPNISIDFVIGGGYHPPHDHWIFVDHHHMGRNDINRYYGPRKNNQQYIDNSTVINNTYIDKRTNNTFISGPRKDDVQKATGTTVKIAEVKESSKPGESFENNQLKIFRPEISKPAKSDVRPAVIADKKDVKPITERSIQKGNEEKINNAGNKEPLPMDKVNPRTPQTGKQQNENVIPKSTDRQAPVQQNKQPYAVPQNDKAKPKSNQIENQQKQNESAKPTDKQAPVQQNKQPVIIPKSANEKSKPTREDKPQQQKAPVNINEKQAPVQQKPQPIITPQPLPVPKGNQQRQKEPNVPAPAPQRQQNLPPQTKPTNAPRIEPKVRTEKPIPPTPRKEE